LPQRSNSNGIETGRPTPLGAVWDGAGVNFALYSRHATGVELCLFNPSDHGIESGRMSLPGRTDQVRHGYVRGLGPGSCYGYRVHGRYAPGEGHRFNSNKLLIDPYARSLVADVKWVDAVYDYVYDKARRDGDRRLDLDERDSAPFVPKSVVVDPGFDWEQDRAPRVPWRDTLIYECHVKGLTARHPEVSERVRGTYLGLVSEPILDHLASLGVTAVELLPVQHAVDERRLVESGLVNYWGYNPIALFAPARRYATADAGIGGQVEEFKSMVKALHRRGIEVILDVVFNHTAEGDHLGPTLSFRGIDNATYYRLDPANRVICEDFTGCGNTLDFRHPRSLQLVLDCLRYWVDEMHVDGFRFDLATALIRGSEGVDPDGPFLEAVANDPVLSEVKLIAEPWDAGGDGYQLGGFPQRWAEWNDKYQATMRAVWRGDAVLPGELSRRLAGSCDVFRQGGRGPLAGVNYVACHDGFTLQDLVSYDSKHNEANGEENRDGPDNNLSRNWGVEGPTDDAEVVATREQVKRNLVAGLAFSLGVPMLTAGDELGRTQRGNNNAYCQDNGISWVDWKLDKAGRAFLDFVRRAFALRGRYDVFRREMFLDGQPVCEGGLEDVSWVRCDGLEMQHDDWHDDGCRTLGMLLHTPTGSQQRTDGGGGAGETVLVVYHAGGDGAEVRLPSMPPGGRWVCRLNTGTGSTVDEPVTGEAVRVGPRSVSLFEYESIRE
jgi:glycogen operon protein